MVQYGYNGTYERSLSRKKEYTDGAWLLRDYGSGGRAKGGSDSAKKRSSNAVIGHIHPGPPLPPFFFFFFYRSCLEPAADMRTHLPQQDTPYVVRDLYGLPPFSIMSF